MQIRYDFYPNDENKKTMTESRHKIRIIHCTRFFLCGFLCVMILTGFKPIDKLLLLEKRNPTYWKLLSSEKAEIITLYESVLKYSENDLIKKNILLDYEWEVGNQDGVTIDRDGNRISVNGVVKQNMWPGLTKDYIALKPGQYFISASGNHEDIYTYLVSVDRNNEIIYSREQGNGFFTVSEDAVCKFNLAMTQGAHINKQRIAPVITYLDDHLDHHDGKAAIWHLTHSSFEELTDRDWKLFRRQIKFQEQEYLWCSIIFEDGTGIQFIKGEEKTGSIDRFGRVK